MNNNFLHQLLQHTVKPDDVELLLSNFTARSYKKGEVIIREGQVCNYIFYIEKGLIKLVTYNNDREFVMQFFDEGYFMSVIDSFTLQLPSTYALLALEDCELLLLHRNDYEQICTVNLSLGTLFRKIMQAGLTNMMNRIGTRLKYDATYRYEHFVKSQPNLLQRINLGDLANYLGITQASLSKIRAKK